MTTWNEMTETAQLGCIYSDSHKEVFGFRPRHMTPEQMASVEWLKNAIAKLDEMPLEDDIPDAQSPDVYEDEAGRYLDEPEVLYGDSYYLEDYYDGEVDF